MIEDLIKKGLLDKKHNLTQKGHEYVESLKKDLQARTAAEGAKIDASFNQEDAAESFGKADQVAREGLEAG